MEDLSAEIDRFTLQLSWLKNNLALMTRQERLSLIEWEDPELAIKTQAELLGLARSSLYYKPKEPEEIY